MSSMYGYHVSEFGGPEVMVWRELEPLTPGPRQLLVEVGASGINFAETRMRAGTYSGQPLPFVMGMEVAGTVVAVGAEVREFGPGQRVFGRARGAHATHVLLDAEHAMPTPDSLTDVEAAAIPVGWLTAWHAVVTVGETQPGEHVLIEAIASSVGSAALQIAKWRGAWVGGTASRDDKLQLAKAAGADAVYNYKTQNLTDVVAADIGTESVDVGLMTIGEETAASLMAVMGNEGRIVMYGSTGGRQVCFNLNIGTRNLQLRSMSISTSPKYLSKTLPEFQALALPMFENGTFKPTVAQVLPMDRLVRAHEMVDERRHYGKIILTNQQDPQ